jgi:arylsulfatase A-like enzyme
MVFKILKKNIIFIFFDGARLEQIKNSEFFSSFAKESVFFNQMITSAPYTTAALHAMFSGCYGNKTETNSYWKSLNFKKEKFKSLISYLNENNYHTCGDVHSKLILAKHDFNEFHIHDELNVNLIEHHCNLIKNMKNYNKNGKNFFLFLDYSKIHTGIMQEVLKKYDNFSDEYFKNKDKNESRYNALFDGAEQYFKEIIKFLKDENLLDNSLLILTSDHGISIGEKFGERAYGAFCYDYTVKLFAYFHSNNLPTKEISSQVRHIDLMPTILDYLGIDFDTSYEKIDGHSLLPIISGDTLKEEIAYIETANPLNEKGPPKEPNTKAVRTSKWKLILNEYNNSVELYDLENDPDENNNLANQNLDVETELLKKLQEFNHPS